MTILPRRRVKPGRLVHFPACLSLYPRDVDDRPGPFTSLLVTLAARSSVYRAIDTPVAKLVAAELAGVVTELRAMEGGAR